MAHACVIAGQEVELAWTQDAAKRFAFRVGDCGGEPTPKQFTNPSTAATALCKALWALLPPAVFAKYPDPEALFVAIDHDKEGEAIFAAISGVYTDRFPSKQKKTSSKKGRLRK